MLSIDLRGKRALVAGVADDAGYGFAIAKALAEAGQRVGRYQPNHMRVTSKYTTKIMSEASSASPAYVAPARTCSEAGLPRTFS